MSHHLLQPEAQWKNRRTRRKTWKQASVQIHDFSKGRFSWGPRRCCRSCLRRGRNADQTAPSLRLLTAALNDTQRLFSAVGISGKETTSLCLRSADLPLSIEVPRWAGVQLIIWRVWVTMRPHKQRVNLDSPSSSATSHGSTPSVASVRSNTDLKQVNWGFLAPINRHWRGNK